MTSDHISTDNPLPRAEENKTTTEMEKLLWKKSENY